MFFVRRVVGKSMLPTLKPNRVVVFKRSGRYHIDQIVCASFNGKEIVKRVKFICNNYYYLEGDYKRAAHCLVRKSQIKGYLVKAI